MNTLCSTAPPKNKQKQPVTFVWLLSSSAKTACLSHEGLSQTVPLQKPCCWVMEERGQQRSPGVSGRLKGLTGGFGRLGEGSTRVWRVSRRRPSHGLSWSLEWCLHLLLMTAFLSCLRGKLWTLLFYRFTKLDLRRSRNLNWVLLSEIT